MEATVATAKAFIFICGFPLRRLPEFVVQLYHSGSCNVSLDWARQLSRFVPFSRALRTGRKTLRATVFLATAAALAVLSGSALAAWKEHPYKDLGFAVEFPDEPAVSAGNYKTVLVPAAPVHIYTKKQDDAMFVASVVDLQDRAGEGASLLIEAEFNLGLLGDISADEISRVEPGKAAVFGHF